MPSRSLPDPQLVWSDTGTPASARFGDGYHSRSDGLAEKRHVFLGGCGFPDAWSSAERYVIGELGFGLGLTFLATWALWERTRPRSALLHYIAVEGYPIDPPTLRAALEAWPELAPYARALLDVYPLPQPGFQRLFPQGSGAPVMLTLLCGDAGAMLDALDTPADAWFLDGFAPDKNPEIWTDEIFRQLARLSHRGTRIATYSVAAKVRAGLSTAGFAVERTAGFGAKREALRGVFDAAPSSHSRAPWFAPARAMARGRAAIVGAGIAGASAAHALVRRGWQVSVLEAGGGIAPRASGNPSAVAMPRLTAAPSLDGMFYETAWPFATQARQGAARGGVLQLATTPAEEERQASIAAVGVLPRLRQVSAVEASDIAGCRIPYGALYFPDGGVLDGPAVCAATLGDADLRTSFAVVSLRRSDHGWVLTAQSGASVEADIVVLANALATGSFAPALPVQARRGQISLAAATETSATLRSVLAYGGTITPAVNGVHCLGATFDWASNVSDVRADPRDDARNLAALDAVLPGLLRGVDRARLQGRAAIRCTSPDHLPMVGPLPDAERYQRDYHALRHGHHWTAYPDAPYQQGLYVLTALGSRGFVAAPIAAELLACHITGEPAPLPRVLSNALHPARFLVRALKRSSSNEEV